MYQLTRAITTAVFLVLAARAGLAASVTVTGSLTGSRAQHSATLLTTGQVLIAGGETGSGALVTAEIYHISDGRFTAAANLLTARWGHTGTLLRSGKVLIAGGRSGSAALNTAEIFDPATRTFSTTGNLNVARHLHTATLLPSGKVLVVGGSMSTADTASAELYDPEAGSFTVTGPLPSARVSHTSTLLASGRVLVAGGFDSATGVVALAAIYDEQLGTFVGTGGMTTARRKHTATVLRNGNVLVTGGEVVSNTPLASAEIYSIAGGTFALTGSLNGAKSSHLATLLPSGKVVVAGSGQTPGALTELYDPGLGTFSVAATPTTGRLGATATLLHSGGVLLAGGKTPLSGYPAFAEIFDGSSGEFTSTTSLTTGSRYKHTATMLLSGKVLIAGGYGDIAFQFNVAHTSAELFDPDSQTMTATGSMATARFHHTATLLANGKVLVAGGQDTVGNISASCELYDPVTGVFTPTGSLSQQRAYHTATLLPSGKVLIAGGLSRFAVALAGAELFDPATGTFSPAGNLVQPRVGGTATLLPSGEVLLAGGGSGYVTSTYFVSAELYDPTKSTFAPTGNLITARQYHSATLLDSGRVLIAGGVNGRPENRAEIYDLDTGTFSAAGTLSQPRGVHAAVRLQSGKVLLAGGSVDYCCSPVRTAELYDPLTATFAATGSMTVSRMKTIATLLPSGKALIVGGDSSAGYQSSAEVFDEGHGFAAESRPVLNLIADEQTQASVLALTGTGFRGTNGLGPESGSGGSQSSSANHPIVRIRRLDSEETSVLPVANGMGFSSTLFTSSRGWSVTPGPAVATITVNGVSSRSVPVTINCGTEISAQPQSQIAAIGSRATFSVSAYAAVAYQWQKDATASGTWKDESNATEPAYSTPLISGVDSGSRYRAIVRGNCAPVVSEAVTLTVADATPPAGSLVSPTGGEYWLLSSTDSPPHKQVVTWTMTDDVRICRVDVSLVYSDNGGRTYLPSPAAGGLPATFGAGGSCVHPGEGTTNLTYTIPTDFPSGRSGSLYKIQVVVTDQKSNAVTLTSPNPFYIVQANPDSVKTLILSNVSRMVTRQGVSNSEAATINGKLQELANHPRVQGVVVDLGTVTSLNALYAAWDADPSSSVKANTVLFGTGGIHHHLKAELFPAYSGVEYLVLVGDDRIIPMARMQDRTVLLLESAYTDLSPTLTTVGRALAAGKYLTDDPLTVLDGVGPAQLDGNLFLPDLAVGRLVETPDEIITTIATYISQDGILDLSLLDPSTGHKVLVTGYDFLSNVSGQIRARWKSALRIYSDNNATAPVDGSLVGGNWGLGSVALRTDALRARLAGNGGPRYGVMAISGHATHYEEGVPGTDPSNIQGLPTRSMYGADCGTPTTGGIDLAGGVIYAVGCHGGLSVPGSCSTDGDHSLDLPQTMLARGAVAYIANSGYGWGLKYGIGYGARLMQIFTEEMTTGGTINVGVAVRETKQRYFLETPRYDAYDEKSVMQWTLYGLPMYAVRTSIAAGSALRTEAHSADSDETLGAVRVKRTLVTPESRATRRLRSATDALPGSLTQLSLAFDFSGAGVYTKYDSSGIALPAGAGCGDPNGCYYTLNGLVDRGSGSGDLPIQPYLIYDSRLSGSSQHGVLWKGGTYDEESGWKPVIAELVSNGGDGSNHGSTPRTIILRPTAPRVVPGVDSPACRPSDLELNSLTVPAGEAIKGPDDTYSIARRYRNVELEVFYFNDRNTPTNNCDRTEPSLGTGPFGGAYHQISGSSVSWSVPASDPSGMWRVLVVYNTNTVDSQNRGTWIPLDLTNNGNGIFQGNLVTTGTTRLTYVIQAVDNRGNVTWLDYVSTELPASGVRPGIPQTVEISFGTALVAPANVVANATTTTSVALTWSSVPSSTSYDIYRSVSGLNYVKIGSSATVTYIDNTALPNIAYLYTVRTIDASAAASGYSNADLATTVMFTDPTLTVGVTAIKAAHINELRTAVNAVRILANLNAYTYTDTSVTSGVTVKAAHINDLRSALGAARGGLMLPPATYDSGAGASMLIKAAHVADLRTGVR